MPKMVQVRNVPDQVHATLRARATAARMSLSDYVLRELERLAECATDEEIFDEVRRSGVHVNFKQVLSALDEERAERESRW